LLQRGDQRVLRQFFGQAHVAHHARDGGDDLCRLHAPDGVDGAVDGGFVLGDHSTAPWLLASMRP
jgi:hypothetical protein